MSNQERRKQNKRAISSHITAAVRQRNKQEDGKPVHALDVFERRYVAQMNRFVGDSGTWIYPIAL
tara:strand:- start:927 stop:1121 length:195 start_codon:yes stop_codon:yes gene_type:complete